MTACAENYMSLAAAVSEIRTLNPFIEPSVILQSFMQACLMGEPTLFPNSDDWDSEENLILRVALPGLRPFHSNRQSIWDLLWTQNALPREERDRLIPALHRGLLSDDWRGWDDEIGHRKTWMSRLNHKALAEFSNYVTVRTAWMAYIFQNLGFAIPPSLVQEIEVATVLGSEARSRGRGEVSQKHLVMKAFDELHQGGVSLTGLSSRELSILVFRHTQGKIELGEASISRYFRIWQDIQKKRLRH